MTPATPKWLEMIRLQDETNSRVDPNWKELGWDFNLAIQVEAAEAVDHYGYKWWKPKDPDIAQTRMEMVDILHFILSKLAMRSNHSDYFQLCPLREAITYAKNQDDNFTVQHCLSRLMGSYGIGIQLVWWANACVMLGMHFDDVFKMYVGKAALNRFRWADSGGYRADYEKIWDGREDNEHLTEILDSLDNDDVSVDNVLLLLGKRYDARQSGELA